MIRQQISILTCLLCAIALMPQSATAATFADYHVIEDIRLERVGTGTFRWTVFRLYEGALFLAPGDIGRDPLEGIPKRLELVYSRNITAAQLVESGNRILQRMFPAEHLAPLQQDLDRINAAFHDVSAGDRYALTYIPGVGTTLERNGEFQILIEGRDFAATYFAIWLSKNGAKASFRNQLL